MFKKISSIFILIFLMHTNLWADFKAQDFSTKKITGIPLFNPIREYIFQHQNQIYTIQSSTQSSGNIKHWNEAQKGWEDFNEGLRGNADMLYSDGKKLYAATPDGVYGYDSKVKKWGITGHLSEGLDPYAISQSGGKLTLVSGNYGVYQLSKNNNWEKVPAKGQEPPSYGFWGMSKEMVVVSSGTKIYAYSQARQEWIDISANIEQEITSENKIRDLMVIGETFYIGLKGKGIFKRDLKDTGWSPFNEGIGSAESFLHFSMPYEELIAYSNKNQYRLNAHKTAWVPLNLGLENLDIVTLSKRGKQIFASSKNEVFVKEGAKIESANQGLETADNLIYLEKSKKGFLLSSIKGLFSYDSADKKWKNSTNLFSPGCSQTVYPILLRDDKV
ncbi:MAG: hypothetical protein HQM15_06375 [Deltaproteobacteria bacterium]|nr:hypothetical protein [Deltaproteobacteria bacterium]